MLVHLLPLFLAKVLGETTFVAGNALLATPLSDPPSSGPCLMNPSGGRDRTS